MPLFHIISRIRHFRGHGLHSPFVYGLKRDVFMGGRPGSENTQLFNALIFRGIDRNSARELQNMHDYCNFINFEIVDNKSEVANAKQDTFYIVLPGTANAVVQRLLYSADKASIVVIGRTTKLAKDMDNCLRIRRKRYWALFRDKGLTAQTFKL